MIEPQSTQEPISQLNPWKETLEQQGINFEIPPRFLELPPDIHIENRDRNTGLAVETDTLRRDIAVALSRCIRDGKNWAVVYSDVDNLKQANEKIDRDFGDMVIRYGAASTTRAVEEVDVSPNAQVIATRRGQAADETIIWLFDISTEELERLEKKFKEPETSTEVRDPNFTFSTSTVLITSNDPKIQEQIEQTKSWLKETDDRIAFEFYQTLTTIAETDVKLLKTAKDLARLPIEQLLTVEGVNGFIEVITQNLGNSRIGDELLETILKLTGTASIKAIIGSIKNREAYQLLLQELGISEEEVRQNGDPRKMLSLFERLFGSQK